MSGIAYGRLAMFLLISSKYSIYLLLSFFIAIWIEFLSSFIALLDAERKGNNWLM